MNNYLFLISEREHGNFEEYMRRGLIGTNLLLWIEVYAFPLVPPPASTWVVADKFGIDQKHVRNIYAFMEAGEKG